MTYNVVLTKRAIKDLDKLDGSIRKRIAAKLKEYAQNPFQHARKLSDTSIGTYRFRIGDYRAVFD